MTWVMRMLWCVLTSECILFGLISKPIASLAADLSILPWLYSMLLLSKKRWPISWVENDIHVLFCTTSQILFALRKVTASSVCGTAPKSSPFKTAWHSSVSWMCCRAETARKLVFNFLCRVEQCVTSLQSNCWEGGETDRDWNKSHIWAKMEQKKKLNKKKSSPFALPHHSVVILWLWIYIRCSIWNEE